MPFKRALPAIVILFTNALGATLVIPILPLLAIDQFGATILQAILLESSYYAAKLLAAPVLGRLSDQYGRRPILIISQAGTFASFLLFIAALPVGQILNEATPNLLLNGGLIILYAARVFDGLTGGNTTVAKAYITDVTADKDHAQAFGLLSATLGIGFVIGPAVGGLLAASISLQAPFIAGAIVSGIALVLAWFLLTETNTPENRLFRPKNELSFSKSLQVALSSSAFTKILLIGLFSTMCFAALSPSFVLYVDQVLFPESTDSETVSRFVGFLYTVVGLSLIVTQVALIKPLVSFFGERQLVRISLVGMFAVFLCIPLTTRPYLFMALLIPFVMVYGLLEPNLQALIAQSSEGKNQGELFGIYQSAMSGSDLIGPLWAGLVFQQISPQAIWWVAAGLLVPATFISFRIANSIKTPLTHHENLVKES